MIPGENSDSCGTAGKYSAQYVLNIRQVLKLKNFVVNFTIGACWSCPIKTQNGKAIGPFALSSFEERAPSPFYKQLLETSAHIAGIIL